MEYIFPYQKAAIVRLEKQNYLFFKGDIPNFISSLIIAGQDNENISVSLSSKYKTYPLLGLRRNF